MILKIRKAPRAKTEMFTLTLPTYIWLEDYHDGKIVQGVLRKFGPRVRVEEMMGAEPDSYKFRVRVG